MVEKKRTLNERVSELELKVDFLESLLIPMKTKNYRGWTLQKRGINSHGKEIFNLGKKVNGKFQCRYLGVWSQEKADNLINEFEKGDKHEL